MKQLLTILFILSCFAVSAQSGKNYPADFTTYGVHYPRGNFDSALHIPVLKDTFSVRDNTRYKDSAEIGIFQGELWFKLPKGFWKKAGGGNGNGGGVNVIDSILSNTDINIKWFNPNLGDSITPAIDAYNAAKAVVLAKGGGTIYFPAGKYPAVDANGWMPGMSNVTWKGDGIGRTVLLPPPGIINGGLQMAPYRDAGWLKQVEQLYTYEDSAAIGQDYIVMKAGQDLSAFQPGTTLFINDGASHYDQLYGEHNTVYKVQGNRVYLKDNLSRDYTAARGSWAATVAQSFVMPDSGQTVTVNLTGEVPDVSPYYGISINNNLFKVIAVTSSTATLRNMGKGNAATGTVINAGSTVMKARVIILTPSTIHDVRVEDMTVIGRRKALTVSNSVNTYFKNVQFKWLSASDGGGLTIDGDDGKNATLDHCSMETPYFFPSQVARSFTGFNAYYTHFINNSIDLTEFATGEIAFCRFDVGREIDSLERFPNNPAITIGASASNVYVHDNTINVSNRSAAIASQPDIQVYVGNSAGAIRIERNTINCNNCNQAINVIRNGDISVIDNHIYGSMRYIFNIDGRLYDDNTNQRSRNSNWFQYGNTCIVKGNTFGGYTNALNFRTPHNIEYIDNHFNRLGGFSINDSSIAIALGNVIKQPDTLPIQRLVMRNNEFRNWVLTSNSFNVASIDSLRMDISLNYFYGGARDSIVTLFTPFDNRYNKSTASSFTGITSTIEATQQAYPYTGYTVNTGEKVGFQFFKNSDGSISIQAALIGSNTVGAMKTTEGETLKTTEGETIIFN